MSDPARPIVLFVEDEDVLRRLGSRVLEREGYEVLLASDAEGGLAAFETAPGRVRLLIADLTLPGRSGFELASDILARRRDVRVLFISGYGEEEGRQLRSSIPGAAFLPKPFTALALIQAVAELLGRVGEVES